MAEGEGSDDVRGGQVLPLQARHVRIIAQSMTPGVCIHAHAFARDRSSIRCDLRLAANPVMLARSVKGRR
jgi:hypothetical protein